MKKNILISLVVIFLLFGVYAFSTKAQTAQLPVPFISQAPEQDWAPPWNNTCEEASLSMVDFYYDRVESARFGTEVDDVESDVETQKKVILDVLALKEQQFGPSEDEMPERVVEIIEGNFDWTATLIANPYKQDIIREVKKGHPVIVPLHGQVVNKGQFSEPGPDYHMAVIVGYEKSGDVFIVHDPGSAAQGKNIRYSAEKVLGESMDSLIDEGYIAEPQVIYTQLDRFFSESPEGTLAASAGTHDLSHEESSVMSQLSDRMNSFIQRIIQSFRS